MYSAPMDVRAYALVILTGWQGTGLGSTPASVEFVIQQSPDLDNWSEETTFSPTAGEEESCTVRLLYPWVRVGMSVAGSDPGVSCWLVGEFVRREGA